MERNQQAAAHVKHEAAVRRADAQHREQVFAAHVALLHDEIASGQEDARQAKAAVVAHKAAVGSTIRAVKGALEQKKGELQAAKEAEARKTRNRVREAGMVMVPPEVAAAIARSNRGGR